MLSKLQATKAIRLIRKMVDGHDYFYQNKRKTYRDFKWDYLDEKSAAKISRALAGFGLEHVCHSIPSRWGLPHGQIRIAAPLDFSLKTLQPRHKRKLKPTKEALRARFNKRKRGVLRAVKALRFANDRDVNTLYDLEHYL